MYNTHTFDNGLRIIQRPSQGEVVYCGYALKVGSADERDGEAGLAHFCEHAAFKGTKRRKAAQIIQTLESVGGELNAYTNKESTVYYCAIQRQHLSKAIDVLTDMVFHAAYPTTELEREKEVICDEIESYNDSPAELIFDEFENIIFHNHPLGHNILGTKESVRAFSPDSARSFAERFYRPENAIFFLHGTPLNARGNEINAVVRDIERAMKRYPVVRQPLALQENNSLPQPAATNKAQYHQAHVIIGRRAYDINHPRRIALYMLNNILGGPAMSSRLNMALRELNGLVYNVESSMVSYGDTGLWCIYFACDPHDTNRCIKLARRELDKLMNAPLTPTQLNRAKQQLKGQIALACDSRESFALDFAKSFLHYGWEKDVTSLCRNIDALTAEELQQTAKELFEPEGLTILQK